MAEIAFRIGLWTGSRMALIAGCYRHHCGAAPDGHHRATSIPALEMFPGCRRCDGESGDRRRAPDALLAVLARKRPGWHPLAAATCLLLPSREACCGHC